MTEAPALSLSENNLIWIDLEMTGLDPETCGIVQMGMILTDTEGLYTGIEWTDPPAIVRDALATHPAWRPFSGVPGADLALTVRVVTREASRRVIDAAKAIHGARPCGRSGSMRWFPSAVTGRWRSHDAFTRRACAWRLRPAARS